MASRRLTSIAARPVRFAFWMFGPLAPSIDMILLGFITSWAIVELFNPAALRNGALIGVAWLPNHVWLVFHICLALAHAFGLRFIHASSFRVATVFLSSWQWLVVSISIARIDITTSALGLGCLGIFALFGGIYLAGLPPRTES